VLILFMDLALRQYADILEVQDPSLKTVYKDLALIMYEEAYNAKDKHNA